MKKYIDIERIKSKYADYFTQGDTIVLQTKIDGSNASFTYDTINDTIIAFSRRKELDESNNLNGFYEWTQSLDKSIIRNLTENGRYIIFGEWLIQNKIKYPENMYKKFYMFDVWDTEKEEYLPYDKVWETFTELNKHIKIEFVPVIYTGEFISWEDVYKMMTLSTTGATPCEEGIVIKNQTKLNHPKIPFYLKIVSEHFSEVQKAKKPLDPAVLKAREIQMERVKTIVTKRRIEKAIMRLCEDGIIPYDWDETHMSIIAKNLSKMVYADCVKEENETVLEIEGFGKLCGSISMEIARQVLKERESL